MLVSCYRLRTVKEADRIPSTATTQPVLEFLRAVLMAWNNRNCRLSATQNSCQDACARTHVSNQPEWWYREDCHDAPIPWALHNGSQYRGIHCNRCMKFRIVNNIYNVPNKAEVQMAQISDEFRSMRCLTPGFHAHPDCDGLMTLDCALCVFPNRDKNTRVRSMWNWNCIETGNLPRRTRPCTALRNEA